MIMQTRDFPNFEYYTSHSLTFKMEEIATQLGEELINSILQNDPTPIIKSLVETGAPVWYQNEAEGISPLYAAAYSRNLELVEFLIEKGAIWNAGAHSIP